MRKKTGGDRNVAPQKDSGNSVDRASTHRGSLKEEDNKKSIYTQNQKDT